MKITEYGDITYTLTNGYKTFVDEFVTETVNKMESKILRLYKRKKWKEAKRK